MSDPRNLGCIDPHGMYPFPVSREVCPKCQAIRAQATPPRRGLPYGWWKSADFWVTLTLGVPALAVLIWIIAAWFFNWQPIT